jgi:hypothetical protein
MIKRKTLGEDISHGDHLGRFYSKKIAGGELVYKIIDFIRGDSVRIYLPNRVEIIKEQVSTLIKSERFSEKEVQNFLDTLK